MDREYEDTMMELGARPYGEPPAEPAADTGMTLEAQLNVVLPRVPYAIRTLQQWLMQEAFMTYVVKLVEPGMREGYHTYGDQTFMRSHHEVLLEAMEELRDLIIYIAIMLEKEERGEG